MVKPPPSSSKSESSTPNRSKNSLTFVRQIKTFWDEACAKQAAVDAQAFDDLLTEDVDAVVGSAQLTLTRLSIGNSSGNSSNNDVNEWEDFPTIPLNKRAKVTDAAAVSSKYNPHTSTSKPVLALCHSSSSVGINPLPRHTNCLPIDELYSVPDNKTLQHVPSSMETEQAEPSSPSSPPSTPMSKDPTETSEESPSSQTLFALYDTSERERGILYGPQIRQVRLRQLVDQVLWRGMQIPALFRALDAEPVDDNMVLASLAEESGTDLDFICERFTILLERKEQRQAIGKAMDTDDDDDDSMAEKNAFRVICSDENTAAHANSGNNNSSSNSSNMPSPAPGRKATARSPSKLADDDDNDDNGHSAVEEGNPEDSDSYRVLFCPRCYTFDCNRHGIQQQPRLEFQYQRANALDREVEQKRATDTSSADSSRASRNPKAFAKRMTKKDELVCDQLFRLLEGDIPQIAAVLRVSSSSVRSYVRQQEHLTKLPPVTITIPPPEDKNRSPSVYNSVWYKNIEEAEIHPTFVPCVHEGPCWEGTCSCVDNAFFCTQACVWGRRSKNFFRGCSCKGQCNRAWCICLATNRECDPDLCNCDACSHNPPGTRPTLEQQLCRNDNITMKRKAHLLIHKSTVDGAGWGCFTKYPLKKGSYIHEYIGEVVSQEEAERRGLLYDQQNLSYLFNLSSESCVDANSRGGIARFLNHSVRPNCEVRTIFVNGEHRLGFFATQDIEAESELFFDYGYGREIDNQYLKKAAVQFSWTEKQKKTQRGNTKKVDKRQSSRSKSASSRKKGKK